MKTKERSQRRPAAEAESSLAIPPVRVSWFGVLLVACATFAAFWPALSNGWVDWDDTGNFINNTDYRGLDWSNLRWMFTTFHMGHYQPLAWLTLGWDAMWGQWVFGADATFGRGMNPRAYHITSNLLHTINATLVYVLALRLITWPTIRRDDWPAWLPQVAAAVAALLFALHPLRVENVAWITERRDLVSALLLILTLLAWLKAVYPGQKRFSRWYAVAIMLYGLSLIAKVAGVPMIVAMLALDWHPLRRIGTPGNPLGHQPSTPAARVWLEKLPFVALAVAFSIAATAGQASHNWIYPFERHSLLARVVQSFYGLTFYVWKTLVPTSLLPLYELRLPMPLGEAKFIVAIVIVIIATLLVLSLRLRAPGLFVAALCYAGFLGPVLGLFQNGPQIVADRYAYLPGVALSVLAGAIILQAWTRCSRGVFHVICAAIVLALIGLSALTWRQTQVWRSTATLWTYNCEKDPGSSFSQNGRGFVLLTAGDVDGALPHFREAIRIQPDNRKAHINLWNALEGRGDLTSLLEAYESATAVPDMQFQAARRMGLRLLKESRPDEAARFFAFACQLQTGDAETWNNFGLALARSGQRVEAEQRYRRAIEINPNLFLARYNAGLNYRALNRMQEARTNLEAAVRLQPDHAGAREALQSLDKPNQQ